MAHSELAQWQSKTLLRLRFVVRIHGSEQYCDTTAGCFLSGKLKSPMTPPADTLVLLSTPTCHRCKFVARHLDAKGVEYEYIDVTTDPDWRGYMDDNDLKNVPQTVRGDQRVEGVDLDAINRLF